MKQNKVCTNLQQDFTDAEKAQGRSNIGAVSASEVSTAISNAVGQLDVSDNVTANQFVTSVSESDGRVSVTRRQPVIADVSGLQDELNRITPQVQSDWTQTDTNLPSFVKNKPENLVQDANYVHTDNNFTSTLKTKLDNIASGAEVNVQSDWSTTDTNADSFIKNKPANLVQDASYVHTDNNFTSTLKTKLEGIASGAEVNVQSNWAETNTSSDAYIQNKPSVPSIKTTSTTLPPVDTNVSNMTLFTDGRVTVNNSTDVGLLAPIGAQSDAGKVLTGTYSGSPGKFTASWRAVQSPLSAGNGITIANNIVSAKVKTGGDIALDPTDGIYLLKHEVTFTESVGTITSKTQNFATLYMWAQPQNGYRIDAQLRHSTYGTLYTSDVTVDGSSSTGTVEFTFRHCKAGAYDVNFEHIIRVIVQSSTTYYREEVLAPLAPYFTYVYENGAWVTRTYKNKKTCTLSDFVAACNNAGPGLGAEGARPFGLVRWNDGSVTHLNISYVYTQNNKVNIEFSAAIRDFLATPSATNMLIHAVVNTDGITLDGHNI